MRNSTDVELWAHQRRLARERREPMSFLRLDYPVTLELSRYDPATNREWFLSEIEVIAHLGPGPGKGWSLDGFSYVASVYDRAPPGPKLREQRIVGSGYDPLDKVVEMQLLKHLRRSEAKVDTAWDAHLRERETYQKDRAHARAFAAE